MAQTTQDASFGPDFVIAAFPTHLVPFKHQYYLNTVVSNNKT
jgi:hypothetical protein